MQSCSCFLQLGVGLSEVVVCPVDVAHVGVGMPLLMVTFDL